MDYEESKKYVLEMFCLEKFRKQQEDSVKTFLFDQKNIFFSALTGFGKSLIFHTIPFIHDMMSGNLLGNSIVIVISPLNSLIDDQLSYLRSVGVTSVALRNNNSMSDIVSEEGEILPLLIYCSPETLNINKWRKLFSSTEFRKLCLGVVVDEAHCIATL